MSALQYASPLQIMFNTIYYSNPLVFYGFVAAIILAVIVTYFESVRVGLIATVILSAFFYGVGMFIPYIYLALALSSALLVLDILGFKSVGRSIENAINWVYLSRKLKSKNRKPPAKIK